MINQVGSHYLLFGTSALLGINSTSTIVLLIATALVLFMVPGLAVFYGGLVRRKNVSTIIAQSFISMTVVTIIWIFGGFSLAFGPSAGGFIGDPSKYFLFRNILFGSDWNNLSLTVNTTLANGVPFIAFFLFQLAFAIITPALVSGAFADRLTYKGYILFTALFTLFIYIPVCHWIWGGGFLAAGGAIDWAGGVVIHATCGVAAVISVIVLKKRNFLKNENVSPHSVPLVAIGAAVLFFGWFGFNTGSSVYGPLAVENQEALQNMITSGTILATLNANALNIGITAFANSFIAMTFATACWTGLDLIIKKSTSLTSMLTAGIAGLATITPTAGFIPIWASIIIGILGGTICYGMTFMNHKIHFDDALEVWPVHGIGGLVGSIFVAAFATTDVNSILLGSTQALASGQLGSGLLLGWQIAMIVVVIAWTAAFSFGIFYLIVYLKGKATIAQQDEGLDIAIFKENAYDVNEKVNVVAQEQKS